MRSWSCWVHRARCSWSRSLARHEQSGCSLWELKGNPLSSPDKALGSLRSGDKTVASYFEEVVWAGLNARWNLHGAAIEARERHTRSDYEARLKREIGIIHDMGFPSYFLITWDFIRFARDQGIPVGPMAVTYRYS